MADNRIIPVGYAACGRYRTRAAYMYDYGQVYRLSGFPEGMLPAVVEVHFSTGSGSITAIGSRTVTEGVEIWDVQVPDDCFLRVMPVRAWIYLHDGETDGETKYEIETPIIGRGPVTHEEPTPTQQTEIEQAIVAFNAGVARAETAADAAESAQESAEGYAESAGDSAITAINAASGAGASATQAAGSAAAAAASATDANASREAADVSATNAGISERSAAGSAQAAAGSATGAAASAGQAAQSAGAAAASAQAAAGSATDAAGSAEAAAGSAAAAGIARTGAESAQTAAAGSAQAAAGSATQAAGSATQAAGSATAAAGSATAAAGSASAAAGSAAEAAQTVAGIEAAGAAQIAAIEDKGEEVLESIPEDYSELSDDVGSLKSAFDSLDDEVHDPVTGLDNKAPVIISSASGSIASFDDGADGMPVKKLTVSIKPVQSGTGDPAPDNVRPISGWTGATVTRTGANVFGGDVLATAILDSCTSSASRTGDIVTLPNGSTNVNSASADRVRMHEGQFEPGQYTIIIKQGSTDKTSSLFQVFYTDGTNQSISSSHYDATGKYWRYVSSANKTLWFLRMNRDESGSHTYDVSKCGIFKGEVSFADFVSYQGQTYPISWQTEAGTVYGGTVDLKAGTLTVTDGQIASYAGETLPGAWISDRDVYTPGGTPTTGAQVVYKLATPLVYSMTDLPTITTLPGYNALWADTGAVSVDYCADTKAYVDESAPVQDVQVNGVSVVQDGVANVPIASENNLGTIKVSDVGLEIASGGTLSIKSATSGQAKAGAQFRAPVTPSVQHESTFYGLAKAAGDSTQSASSNAVGAYTDEAKAAIARMLGVPYWYSASLSEVDYDDTIGAILFEAPTGFEIGEVKFAGQFVYDEAPGSYSLQIGFGNTSGNVRYSIFAEKTGLTNQRMAFIGYGTHVRIERYRSLFGYGNYGGSANTVHSLNVDVYPSLQLVTHGTCFYGSRNYPHFFKIVIPKPDWASIAIHYTLVPEA